VVLHSESAAAQTAIGFEVSAIDALKGPKVFEYDKERLTTTVYVVSAELITASAANEPTANSAPSAL
jgi:hypothetical protein